MHNNKFAHTLGRPNKCPKKQMKNNNCPPMNVWKTISPKLSCSYQLNLFPRVCDHRLPTDDWLSDSNPTLSHLTAWMWPSLVETQLVKFDIAITTVRSWPNGLIRWIEPRVWLPKAYTLSHATKIIVHYSLNKPTSSSAFSASLVTCSL